MSNEKSNKKVDGSLPRYAEAPSTHFFYELDGISNVDPIHLYWDGLVLWHELAAEIEIHDTRHLWEFAKKLRSQADTESFSHTEHLRAGIIRGAIVPPGSDAKKVYPYRGMLISAIYFQECERELDRQPAGRIWHLLIVAYYSMGWDTRAAMKGSQARAAVIRHANDSNTARAIVLGALLKLRDDVTMTSISKAKDGVITLVEKDETAKREIEKIDALQIPSLKRDAGSTALDRLRNTLDRWASPRGPYPEIAEAFDFFRRDKRPRKETINVHALFEGATIKPEPFCHPPRLIYTLKDGSVITTRLGPNDAQDEVPTQTVDTAEQ